MSKLRGNAPAGEEVWTARGELRNPADRSDQPGQWAPERTEEAATAASVDKTDHHERGVQLAPGVLSSARADHRA
ncbi:hypothetical protein GLE_0014 [Lysobacter enzymogenes]|uniref:Uncharacterized protein n=1 Tax=Lysobacter enzymogenes TaxID=69 RepID=A0A0S2DAE9_LYSEN|nr:hypothetical protein [Lysobacter enzymogenes]ALN55373.1 hypothetical protein GLE_0014 [Lysobacter enzymogenes]QCW24460.1 hypothetical protein FE772_01010 [Lysobacter enzymogenes]